MTDVEIQTQLTGIFREVFDDPTIVLTDATSANDVALWDSVSFIDLVVSVERTFQVSFTTKEIQQVKNTADLIRLIASRAS
jgi:acyl carrier protein